MYNQCCLEELLLFRSIVWLNNSSFRGSFLYINVMFQEHSLNVMKSILSVWCFGDAGLFLMFFWCIIWIYSCIVIFSRLLFPCFHLVCLLSINCWPDLCMSFFTKTFKQSHVCIFFNVLWFCCCFALVLFIFIIGLCILIILFSIVNVIIVHFTDISLFFPFIF